MSIIEHQHGERPSADSPGCEEYYVLECDVCGECWFVGPKAEELKVNMHVCEGCEKEDNMENDMSDNDMLVGTLFLPAERTR